MHPNVCMLHDIGREGDTGFLGMEYVDGPCGDVPVVLANLTTVTATSR